MLKDEVLHLLKPHAEQLFRNLNNLMISLKKKSYFFEVSSQIEVTIFPASMKILGKLSSFIRELNISINFDTNEDYEVGLVEDYASDLSLETVPGLLDEAQLEELFTIRVSDADGKDFKFETTRTLTAIFKTIKKVAKKPLLYYYFSISPNLLFVSSHKQRLGAQRIYEYLRHIFNALLLGRNADIESWVETCLSSGSSGKEDMV